jgi:hypothetical protein
MKFIDWLFLAIDLMFTRTAKLILGGLLALALISIATVQSMTHSL